MHHPPSPHITPPCGLTLKVVTHVVKRLTEHSCNSLVETLDAVANGQEGSMSLTAAETKVGRLIGRGKVLLYILGVHMFGNRTRMGTGT